MKIVQNSNRWLKKLTRAAALMSLALGPVSAYSQDGALYSGAQPSGGASESTGLNRDGYGLQFRGGHVAGDTVGRNDSISFIGLSPYFSAGNSLIFGDTRLGRANEGGLVWSFGSGYRYYVEDWDVVLGGNGYYDRDNLSGTYLNQWGAGAEVLAHAWELRGNYYQTFGDSFALTGQSVKPGSSAFTGSNLTFTRVDAFAEGLQGFDAEAGFLLPGDFAEKIDLRAFGGGYYYDGEAAESFGGWSTRLHADIRQWLELGLKLTNDEQFDTTVSFTAAVHFGGFRSQEHLKRSAIQRFREPVRRNLNVVTLVTSQDAPGQLALDPTTGLPLTVAHVNSNDLGGPFLGTVNDPYRLLQQGLGAGTDLVYVHAGSNFTAGPENIVNLLPGQQLIGEGELTAGRSTQNFVTVQAAGQLLQVELPKSPTFAAAPNLARPNLNGSIGTAVTMADGAQFSGFTITNPTVRGIFSNGAENTIINDVKITGAGTSAIVLTNTKGFTAISNTTLESAAAASGPLMLVSGGNGLVTFTSTDSLLFGSISNTSGTEALVVENMIGGQFTMNRSSVTDDAGEGVVIRNNTGGTAVIDNLVSTNAAVSGLQILNSAGSYSFINTSPQVAALTVDAASQQSILIDGLTGSATFNAPVDITDRNAGGVEITNSSGAVRFSKAVTLTDHLGAGAEAGILIANNLAGGSVEFSDTIDVTATAIAAGAPQRTEGNGILISGNAADSVVRTLGVTTVNGTDLASVAVASNSGDVEFRGETRITNRLAEGVLVTGSSGSVEFGSGTPRRLTQVNNELTSGSAAISVDGNSGTVAFGEAVVVDATGNPGGGAGIDVRNNTGLVNFTDMSVVSTGGTGFFGLDNRLIRASDGLITTTDETAVDIENSGIEITLEQVSSSDAPDYGIRLVETNKADGRSFIIRPTANTTVAGNGGTISGAKGDGLDNNDAAGIYLANAGQVQIREMILTDNEFGVRIENTESYLDSAGDVIKVNDRDEQFFLMQFSLVNDSDIRGIHAVDLMGLQVQDSIFDNNGDDVDTGYDTIYSEFTVALDDTTVVDTYERSGRPFEVLIERSDFTSNQHDVIRIRQVAGAAGAAVRTQLYNNRIEASDSTDPGTIAPFDARPLLDDGFYMDWNGPARILAEGNSFDMRAATDQMAFVFSNTSSTDLTEMSLQTNQIFVNNLGTNTGAVSVDLLGDYQMGDVDGVYRIANNVFSVGGQTPTAMYFVLPPASTARFQSALFQGNQMTLETDGGTGIEIRRAGNGADLSFAANQVSFRDLGNAAERGFVIAPVSGPVRLSGLGNQMQVISNGINGNGFIEALLLVPQGSAIGQTQINGQLLP